MTCVVDRISWCITPTRESANNLNFVGHFSYWCDLPSCGRGPKRWWFLPHLLCNSKELQEYLWRSVHPPQFTVSRTINSTWLIFTELPMNDGASLGNPKLFLSCHRQVSQQTIRAREALCASIISEGGTDETNHFCRCVSKGLAYHHGGKHPKISCYSPGLYFYRSNSWL